MTITNNNNGHAVTLKSESTDNHTKLDELVNFLDTVKTQSGIGPFMFISEPARIRAKYDENENLILEARTGTIFGILYKKLTSNFPRAIKERDNARKYIIDILENLNVDKNSIYFTLINSELNKKKQEFNREFLVKHLKNLQSSIQPSDIPYAVQVEAISTAADENNFYDNDKKKEISKSNLLPVSETTFDNSIPTKNKSKIYDNLKKNNEPDETNETHDKLLITKDLLITPEAHTANSNIILKNIEFDIEEKDKSQLVSVPDGMSIGSKPNIERLLTDYYVTPSNQIFNEKEVNIEIMPNIENSGKAEFSGNYKSETSSLKFNGIKLDSIDPKKTNFRTQKDNSDYEEKLIKLYEETFENILKKHTKIDSNEKISIVFVPIASEIHGVSLKEARAAAKVIFDFSKKHSNKINIRITTKNKIQSEAISAEFSKLQAQIL